MVSGEVERSQELFPFVRATAADWDLLFRGPFSRAADVEFKKANTNII